MHDKQITLEDLRRQLGLDQVWILIAFRQMGWLGHLARMSPDRIERMALFAWLEPENLHPAWRHTNIPRPSIRSQLWARIRAIMAQTEIPAKEWPQKWIEVANDRIRWKKLMLSWRKEARRQTAKQTWHQKHAPGGLAESQKKRREARVTSITGIPIDAYGRGTCPHCEHDFSSRALAVHIGSCIKLNDDQRQRAQAYRLARARRMEAAAANLTARQKEELAAINISTLKRKRPAETETIWKPTRRLHCKTSKPLDAPIVTRAVLAPETLAHTTPQPTASCSSSTNPTATQQNLKWKRYKIRGQNKFVEKPDRTLVK